MGKRAKFGVVTKPKRDKPKKRPGRHKKRRNKNEKRMGKYRGCLLYTSDAADE